MNERELREETLLKASFRLIALIEATVQRGALDGATRAAVAELHDYVGRLDQMMRFGACCDEEVEALIAELDSRVAAMQSGSTRAL